MVGGDHKWLAGGDWTIEHYASLAKSVSAARIRGYAEIRGKLGHLASKLLILKMSAGEILIHITGPWTYDPCPKLA